MKFVSIVFLLTSSIAWAQAPGGAAVNGRITGIVIDGSSQQPVEFATVALNDPKTNKPVNGSVCDEKGRFTITKVDAGSYMLAISFIGYETYTAAVEVTEKKSVIAMGTIKISPVATELKEVVVEGQRSLVEEKVDRTVYNAENDATARGGDATDVLRRVPMLSVDLDGNVSLRGNSNIRVLINNKPSTIAASSVADALKQIPADQIKSVEVITSPSARYDAEGSSGIINIITKKNTLQGATLGVDLGVGLRGSNLGLNGNYRAKKMGFSLGGWGRAGYNIVGAFENQQTTGTAGNETVNIQTADTRRNDLMGRYNLGWDYDINKYNSLNAGVRLGVRNGNTYQDGLTTRRFDNGTLVSSNLRDAISSDLSNTIDMNLDYLRTFDKTGKEFSVSTQYSVNNRENNFQNILFNESTFETLSRIRNDNQSLNEEITVQADYQTPLGSNQIVEVGGKEIIRRVSSDFQFFSAAGEGEYQPATNSNLANVFNYNQDVTAGYLSYTLSTKNAYSLKAGARYEYTRITANFQNATELNTDIPDYGALVPSVNLSKRLNSGRTVKLAYNRRLQRPSIQFLNPNIQAANPLNVTIGNPSLAPEFTDNFEISYNTFIKGTSLNLSSFVRNTNSAIQPVREVRGDTIFTNYQNIGQENAYGLSVFTNATVGKLSLNGGGDVYYATLANNVPDPLYNASNQGWVYSGRVFGSYNLEKGWGLQFFSFYRGRQVNLQGYQGGFGVYSLGARKDFKNKRGSIGFGAENFITPVFRIRSETVSPVINQKSVNELRNMSFRINLSYRIGKMSFDNQRTGRKRRSVNNDDLKDGGGDGGGMGDGGQGGGQGGGGFRPSGNGRQPATAPAAAAPKMPAANPAAVVKAEGKWTYTVESPQGGNGTYTITKDGEKYTGSIKSNRMANETALTNVTVNGNELAYQYELSMGGNTVVIIVKGIITGDTFTGTMTLGQWGSFPVTGKRAQ